MCFEEKMTGFTKMIHSGTKDCNIVCCAEGKLAVSPAVVSVLFHSASVECAM